MTIRHFRFLLSNIIIAALLAACSSTRWVPARIQYDLYEVQAAAQQDSALASLLAPYADSVNKTMNREIGYLATSLTKSWPSCSLGQFMTDAYLQEAQKAYGRRVDMAFMNTGGIRMNSMEPGPITVGKIYELMPFDNLMILLELKGSQLAQFLHHLAVRGGWPVSGGTYRIEGKQAVDIKIAGQPLQPEHTYTIAVSDYVANGGDDSNVLRDIPQINNGYLQRDAILAYVHSLTQAGKQLEAPPAANVLR